VPRAGNLGEDGHDLPGGAAISSRLAG